MGQVRGFDEQILASLRSSNPEIHRQAVTAAGTWSLDDAWRHVVDLVDAEDTPRDLLLAAILAIGEIRPQEALEVLAHLEDSDDPDISECVLEATSTTGEWDEDELEDDEEDPGLLN